MSLLRLSGILTTFTLVTAGVCGACSVSEGDVDLKDDAGGPGTKPKPKPNADAGSAGALSSADAAVNPGPVDMDAAIPTPSGPYTVTDLGKKTLTGDGLALELLIPKGTQSFALMVDGSALVDELMLADRVTTPGGKVVYDFENDISINRTDATVGYYTLLVPTNPAVTPDPGRWLVTLRTASEEMEVGIKLITKNAPAVDNVLDLNLYFVGLEGLSAVDAVDDPGFNAILSAVSSIYETVGISIGKVTHNSIDGADAETYGVIDSETELAELYGLAPTESSQALNVFMVNDIAFGDAGLSILGLAGGVPGPPTLQGTRTSGVAINMGSYLAAATAADAVMVKQASEELEIILAHESGHFLGLFHTVERNGLALDGEIVGEDPLSDTKLCPDSADADMNNRLSPKECVDFGADNLMFWSPANDSRSLSEQQGEIILRNPVTR